MSLLDDEYKMQEHETKKLYDTTLLADLIRLNYCYSNKEYNNTLGKDIFDITTKRERYTLQEQQEIIENAKDLLRIKYNLNLVNFKENIIEKIKK